MSEDAAATLNSSSDPRELKKAAIELAKSEEPKDHGVLVQHLAAQAFLDKLDTKDAYEGTYTGLRLARVIKTVMDNKAPSTDEVLLKLIGARGYQGHVLRMQLLVHALAVVKPSPPSAVAYWDEKSHHESPLAFDVAEALCANQSKPALELLETKFADSKHDKHHRIAWMRQIILPIRNDAPLLECCQSMVTGSLAEELRPSLVEALFDYKPDEWYRDCDPPEAPPRSEATRRAKQHLKSIGQYALDNVTLTDEQKDAVETGLDEVGA